MLALSECRRGKRCFWRAIPSARLNLLHENRERSVTQVGTSPVRSGLCSLQCCATRFQSTCPPLQQVF